MLCENCGAQLQPGHAFCGTCGAPVERRAPALYPVCHKEVKKGYAFCPVCGAAVPSPDVPSTPSTPPPGTPAENGVAVSSPDVLSPDVPSAPSTPPTDAPRHPPLPCGSCGMMVPPSSAVCLACGQSLILPIKGEE